MADTIPEPNIQPPLQENQHRRTGFLSWLGKKNADPDLSSPAQPVAPTLSEASPDFAVRLGLGENPSVKSADPIPQSMAGAGVSEGPNLPATPEGVAEASSIPEDQKPTDAKLPQSVADTLLAEEKDSSVEAVVPDLSELSVAEPQVPAEPEGSIGADTTNNKESSDGELALRLMEEVRNELKSSSGKLEEAIEEIRNLRVKPTETSMDASVVQSAETLKQPEPVGA